MVQRWWTDPSSTARGGEGGRQRQRGGKRGALWRAVRSPPIGPPASHPSLVRQPLLVTRFNSGRFIRNCRQLSPPRRWPTSGIRLPSPKVQPSPPRQPSSSSLWCCCEHPCLYPHNMERAGRRDQPPPPSPPSLFSVSALLFSFPFKWPSTTFAIVSSKSIGFTFGPQ